MRIGIDLLWVKHKKSGGIESYIRNLLDGFLEYSDDNYKFILFVARDNASTFEKYYKNDKFEKVICNIDSEKVPFRLLWENMFLDNMAKKNRIDLMFIPVYSKPILTFNNIPYYTVIHDLQALHYPEYFSKIKYIWLKYAWKKSARTSNKIIAISEFVKQDIINRLNINASKIKVIYNPIIKRDSNLDFKIISNKYNILSKEYFYTVSSMLPHKNLETLLYVMKYIKENETLLPKKLVISGVGGKSKTNLTLAIKKLMLEENIIITGFVSDEERDSLYKNAASFLFPSLFEGFGMPPIEALMQGTPVITTKMTSIPEVTKNHANYVSNPKDIGDWVENIKNAFNSTNEVICFDDYDLKNVSINYLNEFRRMNK